MANDFTDPRCKALWRLDNGVLTVDSKGTNTLTNTGAVANDLTNKQEGDAAASLSGANSLSIVDGNLDAGVPLKVGDAVKKGTWSYWFRCTSVPGVGAYQETLSKWDWGANEISIENVLTNSQLRLGWGYGTGQNQETWDIFTVTVNRWYHVAVVFDGVAKTAHVRVYDLTADTVTNYDKTHTNTLRVANCPYGIGNGLIGQIDEVVIFNDLLTDAEIDNIRNGIFGFNYVPAGIPLTLTPESTYFSDAPHLYTGSLQLALLPNASYELVAAVIYDVFAIPASTGGWAMGGAGVWGGSAPGTTIIPADADPTGFYLGGGAEAGEPEVVSTIPAADEIAAEVAFKFCGPGATGNATTSEPAQDVIEAKVVFALGGAGVWGQVAPGDIPSAVLVGSGEFVLSGSGFTLDPVVTPTTTVIISTGGFVLGGLWPDPVEVTYSESHDRVIEETAAFEMGGEGVWGSSLPPTTVIVSKGAMFVLGGDGVAATALPPLVIITGDGGFAIGGTGWPTAPGSDTYVLTGETFGASLYSNFDFAAYAQFRGKYYGAGADGIYLLDGPDDAGDAIHSGVRLPSSNFGTANYKRLRAVNIGNQSNGARVRVKANDREGVAEVIRGKAMIARNLQAREMIVDIMDFDTLSHLELVPLIIAWD